MIIFPSIRVIAFNERVVAKLKNHRHIVVQIIGVVEYTSGHTIQDFYHNINNYAISVDDKEIVIIEKTETIKSMCVR